MAPRTGFLRHVEVLDKEGARAMRVELDVLHWHGILFHGFPDAEAADDARSFGGEAGACSDLFAARVR
jgi:hypothetical protein